MNHWNLRNMNSSLIITSIEIIGHTTPTNHINIKTLIIAKFSFTVKNLRYGIKIVKCGKIS